MRKILISLLIVLLLLLGGYVIINKLEIGSLEILGVREIKKESETLDSKIQEASKLASTDYQTELSTLNSSLKTLQKEKQSYEDLVALSNSEDVTDAAKFETYEIEYIWTTVGNHATSEGVEIKLEVTRGSSSTQGLYDLKFTVTGSYIGISDFIYDIENDDSLGFKIEDFNMQPGESTSNLVGTFTCKDISIKIDETNLTQSSTPNNDFGSTNNMENNTTNNTSNASNANTTNSTANTTGNTTNSNTTVTTNSTAR